MSAPIISVEGLGKRYLIGDDRRTERTLAGSVSRLLAAPFRSLLGRRGRSGVADANEFWALRDVSFEVAPGEVLGIIGKNGSGKSTLLKILSRVAEPTEGQAEVRGRVGSLLEVGTGFHPELSGRENVYLNGAILGMSAAEIARRFDAIVDFAGVEKFLDTPVKNYSSGMYMRLAFSVAAHLETEVLIADEVLAVGDAEFQRKCSAKMEEVRKQGRTVLLVSHNMASVLEISSRVIWLEAGRVTGSGAAKSVVSDYLRQNDAPLGGAVMPPGSGRCGAGFLRAFVATEGLEACPRIPYPKSFAVKLQYHVAEPVQGLRAGFRLFNERGVAVLMATTVDRPETAAVMGTPGTHLAEAPLPARWLAPGRYYAEVGLWSPAALHHQHLPRAFAFDVVDPDVEHFADEILRPRLDWRVA